jgi:hypothetical protein
VKPHRTDLISLTFGMIFLGAAGLWALSRQVNLDASTVGWLAVAGLIVLGAVGITHGIVTASQRRRTDDQPQ